MLADVDRDRAPDAGGDLVSARRLTVDWIACDGRGLCAELLPEVVTLDPWGYPLVDGPVPAELEKHAVRAVKACPRLALRLESAS